GGSCWIRTAPRWPPSPQCRRASSSHPSHAARGAVLLIQRHCLMSSLPRGGGLGWGPCEAQLNSGPPPCPPPRGEGLALCGRHSPVGEGWGGGNLHGSLPRGERRSLPGARCAADAPTLPSPPGEGLLLIATPLRPRGTSGPYRYSNRLARSQSVTTAGQSWRLYSGIAARHFWISWCLTARNSFTNSSPRRSRRTSS